MRADVGFIATHLLLAAVGGGLLYALGLVEPRPRRLVMAAGPAYLAGAAAAIPVLILFLVLGIPFRTPTIFLTGAALAAVFVVVGRRRDASYERAPRPRIEVIALVVAGAGLAIWAMWAGRAFAHLPVQLDDARIWSLKSYALFYYDHLESHVFTGTPYLGSHLDYPIFQPVLLASIFRAMGRATPDASHLELWILFIAFAWTVGWVLAKPGRGVAWMVPVALLLPAPAIYTNVKLGYADVTYTCFLAAGAVMVGRWVETRERGFVLLGAVLLGAAANVKNEGAVGALIVIVCAGAVAAAAREERRARLMEWWPAAAVTVAMLAPWRIWVAAQGIQNSDQPSFHTAISPNYLIDRADRARVALGRLLEFATSEAWYFFLAALIAVAVARLVARRAASLAAFYLTTALLLGASVVFAYWTSSLDINFHLSTSIDRTVTGMLVVAAVGLAHLLSAAPEEDAVPVSRAQS